MTSKRTDHDTQIVRPNVFLKWLDRLVFDRLTHDSLEIQRKARIIAGLCSFLVAMSLATMPVLFLTGHNLTSLMIGIMGLFFLGFLVLLRTSVPLERLSQGLLIAWVAFLSIAQASNGGFELNNFIWFSTLPLFATFLLGSKWGYRFAGLSVLVIGTFLTLKLTIDPFPPKTIVPPHIEWIGSAIFLAVFIFTIAFLANLYETARLAYQQAFENEAKRNLELAHERDVAQAASLAKSEFLATMSHELRTPLNAIIGYSEMLREEAHLPQTDAPAAYLSDFDVDLKKINHAGHHLLQLISDILDISKIEAGKVELTLHSFGLPLFLNELEGAIDSLIKRNHNTFVLDLAISHNEMHTDQLRLRQCLINLLSNAAKFTENGTITLRVRESKQGEVQGFSFAVIDTGMGMKSSDLEAVFEKFQQGDMSSTRRHGGTGLGLSITRELCRILQGSIHAESTLGKGSTFRIWLPKRHQETTSQEPKVLSES